LRNFRGNDWGKREKIKKKKSRELNKLPTGTNTERVLAGGGGGNIRHGSRNSSKVELSNRESTDARMIYKPQHRGIYG